MWAATSIRRVLQSLPVPIPSDAAHRPNAIYSFSKPCARSRKAIHPASSPASDTCRQTHPRSSLSLRVRAPQQCAAPCFSPRSDPRARPRRMSAHSKRANPAQGRYVTHPEYGARGGFCGAPPAASCLVLRPGRCPARPRELSSLMLIRSSEITRPASAWRRAPGTRRLQCGGRRCESGHQDGSWPSRPSGRP